MVAAMYLRLSKEDEFIREESNSITMQRLLLKDYVAEHFPDAAIREYADDGYSGTNFDRPGVQSLLEDVKNGEINCIIVKDFSRFARDYIELGSYLEQIFPFMGVRFISVNDKYDSDRYSGSIADIDVNFKNLLYDLYSKDLSVKVRASMRAIKEQGKFVGSLPPFGYAKDPEDRHKFVIAEDEAEIVRRAFRMYADGLSTVEIAGIFNKEHVKTPSQIWHEKGLRKASPKGDVFLWNNTGILRMLRNRTYIGDLIQGVYRCGKIKSEKRVTDPSEWIVQENHHEPIVDWELFDAVQVRLGSRKNHLKRHDGHILVGRLKCACCGHNLRHNTTGVHYYWCPGLNVYNLDGCVRRVEDLYLEEVITYQLQQHIMELEESDKLLMAEKDQAAAEVIRLQKECEAAERAVDTVGKRRMAEFEAYILGKSTKYDASSNEMDGLRAKHRDLQEQLAAAERKKKRLDKMKIHENFAVRKLTPELLDEYVDSIEVTAGNEVKIRWK